MEELANYIDIYEENNLIKIRVSDDEPSNMELSIYECLAFNMGAEALAGKAEFANPHLASGLRKLAMNMKSYAPKISENRHITRTAAAPTRSVLPMFRPYISTICRRQKSIILLKLKVFITLFLPLSQH